MPPARRRGLGWVLGACLLACSAPALAQRGLIDLRPKFEKGEITRFDVTIEREGRLAAAGEELLADKTTIRLRLALEVQDVMKAPTPPSPPAPDGDDPAQPERTPADAPNSAEPEPAARLVLTIESVAISSDAVDVDSTKPAPQNEDPLAARIRTIAGSKINLVTDADGNIIEMSGGGELLGASLLGGVGGGGKGAFGPMLSISKGPGLVRVGDSWTDRTAIKLDPFGALDLANTVKLVSARGSEARLDLRGTMTAPSMGGMSLDDGNYEGSAVWDTEDGMLKQMDLKQSVSLRGDAMGQEASYTAKGTTTIRRAPAAADRRRR